MIKKMLDDIRAHAQKDAHIQHRKLLERLYHEISFHARRHDIFHINLIKRTLQHATTEIAMVAKLKDGIRDLAMRCDHLIADAQNFHRKKAAVRADELLAVEIDRYAQTMRHKKPSLDALNQIDGFLATNKSKISHRHVMTKMAIAQLESIRNNYRRDLDEKVAYQIR